MIRKRIISKSLALSLALAMAVTNMPADIIGSITGDKEISELSDVSAASSDYGLVEFCIASIGNTMTLKQNFQILQQQVSHLFRHHRHREMTHLVYGICYISHKASL